MSAANGEESLSRRTFLGAAVSVGGATKLRAIVDDPGYEQTDGDEIETHFRFGGRVEGWQGQSPSGIDGTENPTLDLQAGTQYRVTWENVDGARHDFAINDADGNEITSTETTSSEGETLSLTFTASDEMDHYLCTFHPDTMVGEIQVGNGTPTEDQQIDATVELGGVIGGWQRTPTNPTLELEAGRRYRVTWENLDGVNHDFTIRDADGNEVIATEVIAVRGATRSVTFTASEEMDQYVCTIHPDTMRGGIEIVGGAETADGQSGEDQTDGEIEAHFELGAVIGGWQGHAPFDGSVNPTLDFQPGNTYEVTWENLDGVPHDFTVQNAEGDDLLASEVTAERGATRSVTFTATEEMAQYVCTIHPDTMRGGIQTDDGSARDILDPSPERMAGILGVLTAGFVVGLSVVMQRYFDDDQEP